MCSSAHLLSRSSKDFRLCSNFVQYEILERICGIDFGLFIANGDAAVEQWRRVIADCVTRVSHRPTLRTMFILEFAFYSESGDSSLPRNVAIEPLSTQYQHPKTASIWPISHNTLGFRNVGGCRQKRTLFSVQEFILWPRIIARG